MNLTDGSIAFLVDRRALELAPVVLLLLVREEALELVLAEDLLALGVDVALQREEAGDAVPVVAADLRHGQPLLALRALDLARRVRGRVVVGDVLDEVVGEVRLEVALHLHALEGAPVVLHLHVVLQRGPHLQPQSAPRTDEPLPALFDGLHGRGKKFSSVGFSEAVVPLIQEMENRRNSN